MGNSNNYKYMTELIEYVDTIPFNSKECKHCGYK